MNDLSVTYGLLAHINDNNQGINDFSDIFIPIVKKGISELRFSGVNSDSSLIPLQEIISAIFSLDIPFPLLRKFVSRISIDSNKKGEGNFQFFQNDGSFIIKDYIFDEFDEEFIDQKVKIEVIEREFTDYLNFIELDIENIGAHTIFQFIDQNRVELASFFSRKEIEYSLEDEKYYYAAEFIKECKANNEALFQILKKIYIGSVIASYLESDFKDVKNREVEFVLDTNVIVSLLDLNSIESYHTCHQILQVGHELGFTFTVLDIHIEETQNLLLKTSEQIKSGSWKKSKYAGRPDSILSACTRRDLTPSDLVRESSNLERFLNENLGIFLKKDTNKYQNMAVYTRDYKVLADIRNNTYSAKKDATALEYVREKRNRKKSKHFYDVRCWVLTASKTELNFLLRDDFLPEIIRTDDLVNILWLSNPIIHSGEMSEIGLTKLISSTISNFSPSSAVISEFEKNIEKIKDKVSKEDCVNVAFYGAKKTLVNLEKINEIAKTSPEEFTSEISGLAELIKKKKENPHIFGSHFNEMEEIKKKLVSLQEIKLKNLILEKSTLLNELSKAFTPLTRVEESLRKDSKSNTEKILIGVPILYVVMFIVLIFKYGWDYMEQFTFIAGLIFTVLTFIFAIITTGSLNPRKLYQIFFDYFYQKKAILRGFNVDDYLSLKTKIQSVNSEIDELKSQLSTENK